MQAKNPCKKKKKKFLEKSNKKQILVKQIRQATVRTIQEVKSDA